MSGDRSTQLSSLGLSLNSRALKSASSLYSASRISPSLQAAPGLGAQTGWQDSQSPRPRDTQTQTPLLVQGAPGQGGLQAHAPAQARPQPRPTAAMRHLVPKPGSVLWGLEGIEVGVRTSREGLKLSSRAEGARVRGTGRPGVSGCRQD